MVDRITFDFGGFTGADFKRVQQELSSKGHGKIESPDWVLDGLSVIARQFIDFVIMVLDKQGLLEPEKQLSAHGIVGAEVDEGWTPDQVMRMMWDMRAHNWAVVETPQAYGLTFMTWLENFQLNERLLRETILSIGSGPGLYESFMASLVNRYNPNGHSVRFVCADFAHSMSKAHKQIIDTRYLGGRRVKLLPTTQDMTSLAIRSESVDQIFCNNSLQWVSDWKGAIREMARVMRPRGLGTLYLFVHQHPMVVWKENGERLFEFGKFTIEELMDELEANRFEIHRLRQMGGRKGTGQAGGEIDRVFLLAQFRASGIEKSWKEKKVSSRILGLR